MAGPISAVVVIHNAVRRDMADVDAASVADLPDLGTLGPLPRMQQRPVRP
jgi:hypothetical protein